MFKFLFLFACLTQLALSVRHELIFQDGNYTMGWEVIGSDFYVDCQVKMTGFIGWGLTSYSGPGMNNSDIVIAGFDESDGMRYVGDYHAFVSGTPILDDGQDVTLVEASQTDGETFVKWFKPLNAIDSDEDKSFIGTGQHFMWSYGLEDLVTYHGPTNRGKAPYPMRP